MGNYFISLIFLMFFGGCSTPPIKIKIQSIPDGANVSSRSSDGTIKSLGKTPLEITASDLNSSGRISSLEVTKEGFQDHKVIFGRDISSENYDLMMKLSPKVIESSNNQEIFAKRLLKAYSLVTGKRFDEARAALNDFIRDYPNVSAGYDLMGNLSYLQRDIKAARDYYERSLLINPDNPGTKALVNRLKGMLQ
jgi:tetratricopeptide (TPR) repeat protein